MQRTVIIMSLQLDLCPRRRDPFLPPALVLPPSLPPGGACGMGDVEEAGRARDEHVEVDVL